MRASLISRRRPTNRACMPIGLSAGWMVWAMYGRSVEPARDHPEYLSTASRVTILLTYPRHGFGLECALFNAMTAR